MTPEATIIIAVVILLYFSVLVWLANWTVRGGPNRVPIGYIASFLWGSLIGLAVFHFLIKRAPKQVTSLPVRDEQGRYQVNQ